jgi:hypothetical protein
LYVKNYKHGKKETSSQGQWDEKCTKNFGQKTCGKNHAEYLGIDGRIM